MRKILLLTVALMFMTNSFKELFSQCIDKLNKYKNQVNEEMTMLNSLLEILSEQNYLKRGFGSYGIGIRRTPKLYILDRDLGEAISSLQKQLFNENYNFNLRYEKLIKSFWAIALYYLAEYYAKVDQGDKYEETLEDIARKLSEQHNNVSKLAIITNLSKYKDIRPNIMNDFGRFIKNLLVKNGTYISEKATYRNALNRASSSLSAVAVFLGGINKILEYNNKKDFAKIYVNSFYMENVLEDIKLSNLYNRDVLLRECVQDLDYIEETIINIYNDELILDAAKLAVNQKVSTTILAAKAGSLAGPKGIILAVAVGFIIESAFNLFEEAKNYFTFYGVSSLLYTLAFNSNNNYRLSGVSIHLANTFMEEKVVGKLTKYSTSLPNEIWDNFEEDSRETEKWINYLDSYFNKKKFIFITYSKSSGKLQEIYIDYINCSKKEKELNYKINYINQRERELPYIPVIMWICGIIAFFLVINFLILLFQFRLIEAFLYLFGGLLSESLIIAVIFYFVFGGSLRNNFYATLGIMSAKVIETTSFVTKEIFGKEVFREETIEVVYYVYKYLESTENIEKIYNK